LDLKEITSLLMTCYVYLRQLLSVLPGRKSAMSNRQSPLGEWVWGTMV